MSACAPRPNFGADAGVCPPLTPPCLALGRCVPCTGRVAEPGWRDKPQGVVCVLMDCEEDVKLSQGHQRSILDVAT